jgi:GT2 family glycosyltransferase
MKSAADRQARRRGQAGSSAEQPAASAPQLPAAPAGAQEALPSPIVLEIEETFFVQPNGIALTGWFFDPNEQVKSLVLCSGQSRAPLDPRRMLSIRRKDVQEGLATRFGPDHAELGYLAYFPASLVSGEQIWLDVVLQSGRAVRRIVPPPALPPIQAMRRILSQLEFPYGSTAPAFDNVVGPVVQGLNRHRLSRRPAMTEFVLGAERPAVCSIVVPVHRRLDLMHYQLALLSEYGIGLNELIYVLDDPPLRREAEQLAVSAHARFNIPFRLLTLDRNVGFAPAVNIGASAARGQYLCLLNSDVFPSDPTWLPRMLMRLQADTTLGVVAPILLFEDGTLQHGGCTFERMPRYSNWLFPMHPGKGMRPPEPAGLVEMPAVTGACMVMRRAHWEAVGGLDEDYAIGDFEDADLCRKLRERQLRCAVDTEARLYHLERRSQGGPDRWRQNLTLFNAWVFNHRWDGE